MKRKCWSSSRIRVWIAGVAGICLTLGGCGLRPREVAEHFLEALAEKDLHTAGNFCSPELRQQLTNYPAAQRAFLYGVERLQWRLRDMGPTKAGGMAAIAQFALQRQWPAPPSLEGMLRLNMSKAGERWQITGGTVAIDHYVELVTNPVVGARMALPQMGAPRWESGQAVNESLEDFVRRYDAYCASWVR
jgi:hypothetical protein